MSEYEGARIDWAAVKERLANAERSLHAAFDEDPARRKVLLRERTRQLAGQGREDTTKSALSRFLAVELGKNRYALDIASLAGVGAWQRPCRMPQTHAAMLGLFADRSATWALYDLALLLGLDHATPGEGGYVLHLRNSRIALRVDGVGSIVAAAPDTARQLPRDTQADTAYLAGVLDDNLIIIDAARIRTHPAFSKDIPA